MIIKIDIPRSPPIIRHERLVALGSLVLGIARQHALQGHAYALYVLDGAPALLAEEVEADDAVGVDVRVHGDGSVGCLHEGYFWGFYSEGIC